MQTSLNLFRLFALAILLIFSLTSLGFAEGSAPVRKIIKLTDRGIEPEVLNMTKDDSIVFFFNETTDSLPTLELDFRGKTAHCASSTLRASADGIIRSIRPIGARDFASTCFHSAGEYDVKVLGMKTAPQGMHAKVIVR